MEICIIYPIHRTQCGAYACSARPIPPTLVHCIPTSGIKEGVGESLLLSPLKLSTRLAERGDQRGFHPNDHPNSLSH